MDKNLIKKSSKNYNKGFTLVELLASVFIIASLSTIFLTNYKSTNRRSELIMTAQEIVSNVRLAQNYSLGSKEYQGSLPIGGWGVSFDKNEPGSYKIFADQNGNKQYDLGETGDREEAKVINFPTGIVLKDIMSGTSINSIDVTFLPPDPIVYIWDGSENQSDVIIKIQDENNSSSKDISINFFGLVDVIN